MPVEPLAEIPVCWKILVFLSCFPRIDRPSTLGFCHWEKRGGNRVNYTTTLARPGCA